MSRDERLYLEDIRRSCEKILRFTRGMTLDTWREDEKTYDAVLRNLTVIGEAVKQLSPALRDAWPTIPWRKIAGLRDVVMHAYFGVDEEIVWDLVENKVPELLTGVERILSDMSGEGT